jgi:hypothetical protein
MDIVKEITNLQEENKRLHAALEEITRLAKVDTQKRRSKTPRPLPWID